MGVCDFLRGWGLGGRGGELRHGEDGFFLVYDGDDGGGGGEVS